MNLRASLRNGASAVVKQLPFSVLRAAAGTGAVLPLYHAVTDSPPAHLAHLGCWRPIAAFRRDLDLLLRGGKPLGLEEIVACVREGRPPPPRGFHLSIDDGLREAGEAFAAICLEQGVPATFFLTTGFLDNQMLGYRQLASLLLATIEAMPSRGRESALKQLARVFPGQGNSCADWKQAILGVGYCQRQKLHEAAAIVELDIDHYLRTARPYLERAEIERLVAQGFSVGAHSQDHPPLAAIPAHEQVRQVVQSLRDVDAWFAPPLRTFAFPFSAHGISPGLFECVAHEIKVDLYFGVGMTPLAAGQQVVDRIPLESKTQRPARAVMKEYYAQNFIRRLRGAGSAGHGVQVMGQASGHGSPRPAARSLPPAPCLVSILIPCYNAERWVAQAIDSALAQTWPNKEVIVVDDGSTDGSLEVIRSFGDRIRWESGPNRGANAARNRLLELAAGQWLQYLDADDYLLPEMIAAQLAAAPACPPADVLFSPITMEYWRDGQTPVRELREIRPPHDLWVLMVRWLFPGIHAVLYRRAAVAAVGGWKAGQPCCQDNELNLRLLKAGKRFAFCPYAGAIYRQWSDQTVCHRNPLLTITKRLELVDDMEAWLRAAGQLTRTRQDAIAHVRLESARESYRLDRRQSIAFAALAVARHPAFRPAPAARLPWTYRLAFRLLGFDAAERIAAWARKCRTAKAGG
jgi:glycosyltransferase involved in cell wall biosynthesis/peptidoglycan/xylan/chitin deacetylase (PgdA/CDA1 family)